MYNVLGFTTNYVKLLGQIVWNCKLHALTCMYTNTCTNGSQIVCTCTCTCMVVFSTYTYIVWFTKMLKAKVINCTKLLVLSLQIICII